MALKRNKKAKFVLFAAVSLDGRITQGKKEGNRWTSAEDRNWLYKELGRYDAVVMGRKTFMAIKRPLTPRNRIVFTKHPLFQCSTEYWNSGCETFGFFGSAGQLLSLLERRNWQRIVVVGGTSIYDWFLKRNLIDEVYLTMEPVFLGSGKPLTSSPFGKIARFRLRAVKRLSETGTLLLHYK